MSSLPLNRREFIKRSAAAGAGTLLAAQLFGAPHVAGSDKLRFGLIGCGGRGTGAAADALMADRSVELVAVSDLFPDRVEAALDQIRERLKGHLGGDSDAIERVMKEQVKVSPSHQFSGWDNHEKLCSLAELDYIVTATPPVFRPHVVEAAVRHGKHMFIEKPVAVDPVGVRKMYALGEQARAKGLSVVAGTQRRYHPGYLEAFKRVQDGQIGEIVSAQAYWLADYFVGFPLRGAEDRPTNDMEYQVRNWLLYVWGSGDHIVEQHIHNMDVVNWFVGRVPETAYGVGGRAVEFDSQRYGDRFSHFAIEYDYGKDLLCSSICRQEPGTKSRVSERIQGTKGTLFLNDRELEMTGSKPWSFKRTPGFVSEFVLEHKELIRSIREGQPIDDIPDVTDSTLTMIAGRSAAYTGMQLQTEWIKQRSQENLTPDTLEFGEVPVPELRIPGQHKLV